MHEKRLIIGGKSSIGPEAAGSLVRIKAGCVTVRRQERVTQDGSCLDAAGAAAVSGQGEARSECQTG